MNRSSERAKLLMRSYARSQGTQTSTDAIRNDMVVNDSNSIDTKTVQSYIDALKQIFVIEDMPAWNPNLRSKTAIRTSNTRYYMDPSIGTAALGIGPQDLIDDLETFGLMFETLCMRDLRVYADALDGTVRRRGGPAGSPGRSGARRRRAARPARTARCCRTAGRRGSRAG